VFGRKKMSVGNIGRAGAAARGVGRAAKESGDIERAEDSVRAAREHQQEVDRQFQSDSAAIAASIDAAAAAIEMLPIRPKKSEIDVTLVALAWAPHWQRGTELTPAW